ncbi:hypothetical protein HYS10_00410, partial [Candidatus Collierbacteria bacterium]|nr:hypothetical protein [Candidatus Collierbacteria bacterium]
MKKRISLLILFVVAIAVLQRSSPLITVFTEEPKATAHWHIASPDNRLGGLIKATLRITTQKGATVDLSRLPEAGDTLALPSKYDVLTSPYPGHESQRETSEGEVEVISRRISQYNSVGGSIVTEVSYEFQYLLPIDFASSRDDKRLPSILPLRQEYLLAKAGKITQRYNVI